VLKFNKQLFASDLIKVSLLNGISTVIKMMTGLVSIKIVSTVIGPAGIALLGQLNNFTNIILVFSNGGINSGITKYLSEYSKSESRYKPFLGTGFWISVIFSALLGLGMILAAKSLSLWILHDASYKCVFYVFGVTIMLYSLNAYITAIINGFKDYRSYIIASILGSIVSLCFSVFLALRFGLIGALISAVTFQSVVFFLTILIVRKSSWFNWKTLTDSFDRDAAVKLGKFSLMALISAITVPGSQMIVRNYITWYRSIHEAGLWEGMNRLSIMYLFVVMTSMSVYYVPRMSEIKEKAEMRKEVLTVYKLMIPFLIISIIFIYVFRDFIITLLFSSEFMGMNELFIFQLLGDFLKMCGWLLGSILIAKAMTRIYIIMELVNFVNITVLSYFAVKWQGAWGATVAYSITHAIYLVCLLFVFRKLMFVKKY
jgi:O-antigen/teichoic acid export membrane protein